MGSSNLAIQPSWAHSSFAVCCLWWDFHSQLHNQASKGLSVRCWVSFSPQLLGQLLSCLVELEVKPKLLDSVQPMSVPALDKALHVSLEVHQVLAKDLIKLWTRIFFKLWTRIFFLFWKKSRCFFWTFCLSAHLSSCDLPSVIYCSCRGRGSSGQDNINQCVIYHFS